MSRSEASVVAHPDEVRGRSAQSIDRLIGMIIEPLAAILIVGELGIMSAAVYARYVRGAPLFWADELAATVFLWLSMLGAAIAYSRHAHMRVSALVARVKPSSAAFLNVLETAVVAVFSLGIIVAVIWPSSPPPLHDLGDWLTALGNGDFFATSYFGQEAIDMMPALQIPRTVDLAGVIVGFLCMAMSAFMRLVASQRAHVCIALALLAALIGGGWLARDAMAILGNLNLVLDFVVLLGAAIAIGVPIAFAFGAATVGYLLVVTHVPLSIVIGQMTDGMTNLVLLAIPMFVLLGLLLEATGIARRLVELIAMFVGRTRGGLNVVLVAAMFLVSGISGSKLADMAAVTPVLFPEMERRGQQRAEMIALLATSAAMAELIPPSLVLIIVGTVCNLSIQSLFIGGLMPAVVASLGLIAVTLLRARRRSERADATTTSRAAAALPVHPATAVFERGHGARRWRVFFAALPGLVLPFMIRYFVVEGITTATEVSTVGIVYTLAVGILVHREFNWHKLYPMLRETAVLTGAIMLMIAMATAMSWALTQAGFASALARMLEHAPGGKVTFMALSIALFITLGALLEGIPAIVLFGPLLFPIALQLHIDGIHYAIVVVLSMSIGMFAPPIGVGYYGACAVGKCDPDRGATAMLPYLGALLAALVVIAAVPWLSTVAV
ncbi:TRAP transporter large permease [Burkholderia pseudomallei]|uniref:TRAP transporter large permease n=1 Tax=Burkholderia pseudomallei TaxID=28450 RepID=UPI002180AC7E|nr:TRAP transporter large permease subunit [Burkholderia pseudomallei]